MWRGRTGRYACAILEATDTVRAAPRRRVTGWDVCVLVAANGIAVAGLWWRQGGLREIHDVAGLLTGLGRLTGLIGAYLALVQLLLLARIPVLNRVGLERAAAWHRRNGIACLGLVVAHTVLVTAGYALADGVSLARQVSELLGRYPGVLEATAGLGLLVLVVATSVMAVRRRLGHRVWHAIHVTAYAAVALAFSHQLATGHEFQGQPVARAYWWTLYGVTAVALLAFRLVLPVARSLRLGLHVERVVDEAPGVVSLEIRGSGLDRLGARSGQSLHWRFLSPGHWWRAHPYSLSAAPDGRRLRLTVKGRGRQAQRLASLRPGTRVIAGGAYGGFPAQARRRPRVALIGGGVGIAPIRAMLEDMPGGRGDIAVIYRASRAGDVLFRDELEKLARRRGADLHFVVGESEAGLLSPERLTALVPDIAQRAVFVCGPRSMTEATRASLRRAGVPPVQITCEGLGW